MVGQGPAFRRPSRSVARHNDMGKKPRKQAAVHAGYSVHLRAYGVVAEESCFLPGMRINPSGLWEMTTDPLSITLSSLKPLLYPSISPHISPKLSA